MKLLPTTAHDHPFPGNVLMRVDRMDDYEDETRTPVVDTPDANVVSSHFGGVNSDLHRPVLDIDFPCAAIPSTTPGHYHLYLDKAISWETYEKLLVALAEAGIIEQGYANVSIERCHTAVRVPWIKKGTDTLGAYAGAVRAKLTRMALEAIQ